jgi:hypothetical protein
MRTRRIRTFALTTALALLALGLGGTARVAADENGTGAGPTGREAALAPAPPPSLADVSATTQTPALFTVAGKGFTPGGRVYLAIYDQMGARLYETRWVVASPVAGLCGAAAMMRALDEATAAWSDWLPVEPACAADAEPRSGPR